MLGSNNCLCYCRNEYLFYVVDPMMNTTIAELEIDSDYWLEHIHVDAKYQKKGIGSKLIEYANKFALREGGLEYGIAICVSTGVNTRYRLTDEGVALINSCIRKKILLEDQVFNSVPQSPSECF